MLNKIKALCKSHGTTLKEVEQSLGFGYGTISHWKTSKPKYDKLVQVAHYFDVSVEYLTGTSKEAPAAQGDGRLLPEEFTARYWALSPAGRASLDQYAQFLQAQEAAQKAGADVQT